MRQPMRILHVCAWFSAIAVRVALPLAVRPSHRSIFEPDVDAPPGKHQSTKLLVTGAKSNGAHKVKGNGGKDHEKHFSRVKPLLRIPGNASRWGHPINLVDELGFHKQLGGAFSLMCTLKLEQINAWQRVFDFSFEKDIDSITAGTLGNTTHLHFTIFKGKSKRTLKVWNFFELGKTTTALFTVGHTGRMRVWKNGNLVGEIEGHAPVFNERPYLMIGGHYFYKKQFFHGVVGQVKLWNKEVMWPPHPGSKPVTFMKRPHGVSVGMMPKKKAPPPKPTPAPHQWSKILMTDEPREFMLTTTTRPRWREVMNWDLPDGQIAGPPLPKPPPAHWD